LQSVAGESGKVSVQQSGIIGKRFMVHGSGKNTSFLRWSIAQQLDNVK